MLLNIEDGWSPGACGCPLRHAASRRATSPTLRVEEEKHRRLSSSGEAGGGGSRRLRRETEGAGCCEPQRIGVALALQSLCAHLRKAFDVEAGFGEGVEAQEQVDERLGARRRVPGLVGRVEGKARYLTGAGADHGAETFLVVDDHLFEVEAHRGIVLGGAYPVFGEDSSHHVGDHVLQALDALPNLVGGKEPAQDDPEQLHGLQYMCVWSPAELRELYPTNFGMRGLKSRVILFRSPTDL